MDNKQLFSFWQKLQKLDEWKKTWLIWYKGDQQRDDGDNPHPKGVTRYDGIQYGPSKRDNLLDVYRPTKLDGKTLPLIINMHGGGFVYGTRATYQFYCMHLAQAGFAVVNYDYRKAPVYPFPYAWHDSLRAVDWCIENAGKYRFDLNNVILIGDSASTNLVEEFLVLSNNPKATKRFGFKKRKINVIASSWNCGIYFLDKIPNPKGNPVRDMMNLYYTQPVRRKYRDFLHIDRYIQRPFPPIFIATANHDVVRDQNVRMDQLLDDRDIPHRFKIYGDANHLRLHDFQMNQKDTSVAQVCYEDQITFYKQHLNR